MSNRKSFASKSFSRFLLPGSEVAAPSVVSLEATIPLTPPHLTRLTSTSAPRSNIGTLQANCFIGQRDGQSNVYKDMVMRAHAATSVTGPTGCSLNIVFFP